MGLIQIPKKKSHDKEWVKYKFGVELKIDYPTAKQEVTLNNKLYAAQANFSESDTIQKLATNPLMLEYMGYCLKCSIKDWRTVLDGEVKNGLIVDVEGEGEKVYECRLNGNELSDDLYLMLAKDPMLITDIWILVNSELEFTAKDKKKLIFTQESTKKVDTKVNRVNSL